jgi:glycerol uptake facilitator-like aquaporin
MSAARLRKPLNAGRQGGFENVGAQSLEQAWGDQDEETGVLGNGWIRMSGRHERQTWGALLLAMVLEIIGSWLVGTAVGLARWAATGPDALSNGFHVGLAYAIALFVGHKMYRTHVLRRHLNGAVTAAYFLKREIGILGVLWYLLSQYVGGLIAGGTINGFLSSSNLVLSNTIPLPRTTFTSLLTVVLAELFIGAGTVLILLITEFMNTPGSALVNDRTPANIESLTANHDRAVIAYSGSIFVVVLFLYQFQIYTFSNVAYFGGLAAGINAPTAARDIINTAQLFSSTYTDSVFGTTGAAWALYLFMPGVAGMLGAGLFYAFFLIGSTEHVKSLSFLDNKYFPPQQRESAMEATATTTTAAEAMIAASLQRPVQSQLRSPF